MPESDRIVFGCDVARYGHDDSVIVIRRGRRVLRIESWHGKSLMETCGRIVALADEYQPDEINVDDAGLGGGVVDRLQELSLPVNGVNVGEAAMNTDRFANARAEYFVKLGAMFRDNAIDIPPNSTLISQLTSIRYEIDSRGRIKIESKDDAIRRGVKSPDFADALMLAFADRTPGIIEYYRERVERIRQYQQPDGHSQPPSPAQIIEQEKAAQAEEDEGNELYRIATQGLNEPPALQQQGHRTNGRVTMTTDPNYLPPGFRRKP